METEKLYSPVNFYFRDDEYAAEGRYDNIDWRDTITHEEAFAYKDAIDLAILRDINSIDPGRGLAEYVPDTLGDVILSFRPAIELHGDSLWCVANVTLSRPITPGEMGELTQWWSGQLSDGWGEGLEQREIKVKGGELYIEPWTPDERFFIATQKEFDSRFGHAEKETALQETPAQAALHEQDIYDDKATAALREQLIQRLDANLLSYFDELLGDTRNHIPDMSPEIAAVAGAHYYLCEIHNFHTSELEYLLQFRDPLAVAADKFQAAGMDDYSDIMWDIFDRKDALQGGYALVPDSSGEEALKQELFRRLDSNLSDYCEGLLDADKEEIIGMAGEIAAQYAVRDYLKNSYDFGPGEVDYLLQFKHPLALVAKRWPDSMDGLVDMRDVVRDILGDKNNLGAFLKTDAAISVAAQGQPSGKTSVLEQIRQAREDAKNNPAPHKDTPGKVHGPEL